MNRPEQAVSFAHSRGDKYSIALFITCYVIEYIYGKPKNMSHEIDIEEANDKFDLIILMAPSTDGINYLEDDNDADV